MYLSLLCKKVNFIGETRVIAHFVGLVMLIKLYIKQNQLR